MGGMGPQGALSVRATQDLAHLKFLLITMTTCIVIRCLAGDFLGSLNDMFCVFAGVFLLREEEHVKSIFDSCCRNGPLDFLCGGSGPAGCLGAVLALWLISGFFNIVQFCQMASTYGVLPCTGAISCYMPIAVAGLAIAQAIGV